MKIPQKAIQTLFCCAMLLLFSCAACGQTHLANVTGAADGAAPVDPAGSPQQVQLKLVDGSSISVDEAWESEQGIWYRQSGMNHLITRDRVRRIERRPVSRPNSDVQLAELVVANASGNSLNSSDGQVVWIFLVGGACVLADSATESDAGVWYKRGPLLAFIERARIDRIERGDLESRGESDSTSKKALSWTTGSSKIDEFIKQSGAKYGVDPYLIFCVMEQESHFNSRALSRQGARGLMQLMPGTSARFGVRRPSDPAQNIAGGTRYLKQLMERFDGRIDLVLASYNAGEGAVRKFGGKVPPFRETRNYVKRISYRYRQTKPVAPAKSDLAAAGGTGN
ncbi:MAG: lytic transglycosylase domain-containing protein [Acidobacteriota bacterium]|nr:lytic transglycosylase domain-containing protein [Acidobacteriota bacterium]